MNFGICCHRTRTATPPEIRYWQTTPIGMQPKPCFGSRSRRRLARHPTLLLQASCFDVPKVLDSIEPVKGRTITDFGENDCDYCEAKIHPIDPLGDLFGCIKGTRGPQDHASDTGGGERMVGTLDEASDIRKTITR